jgi:tight adherence protein B
MAPNELIPGIPDVALALALGLTIAMSGALAYVVAEYTGPRARLRARLAGIASTAPRAAVRGRPDRARQIRTKLKETGHDDGSRTNRRVELRLRLDRAGLALSVRTLFILAGLSGLLATGLYVLLGYPVLFSPAVFAVMGIGLPRAILSRLARRRQQRFTRLFADAIDVIIRGIRSGLPVSECLAIIARESPDPVAGEFKLLVEGQQLGMTLKQALERATRRMPTADMKFFAVVLNLQQHTGGNLAETLNGLSNVLRGRKKMADKVRALSAEARMTATIIGLLPFLVSLVIYAISPGYIMLLWTDPLGNVILYGGVLWMAIGIFIMKQMIDFEV